MNPQEIKKYLTRTPFVPFRVYTSDGRHLDIKHPEMALLTRAILLVGHPVPDPTKDIPPDYDDVSLLHVVKLETLVPV